MFEFTIKESNFLNSFFKKFSDYVNKSYSFTMKFLANPTLADYRENERLILIVLNKSVYQNMYSFLRLCESRMHFSAFACLEGAVNSMRLYSVLCANPNYMHSFITSPDFSMELCEYELEEKRKDFDGSSEQFSLKEFCVGLHKMNIFELKNSAISSHMVDNSLYLGLSSGDNISDDLQHEIRKNLVGAYLSLQKHNKLFFNGGVDAALEEAEDGLYSMFVEYVRKFS